MRAEKLLAYDYWPKMCNFLFNTTLKINRSIEEFAFN